MFSGVEFNRAFPNCFDNRFINENNYILLPFVVVNVHSNFSQYRRIRLVFSHVLRVADVVYDLKEF